MAPTFDLPPVTLAEKKRPELGAEHARLELTRNAVKQEQADADKPGVAANRHAYGGGSVFSLTPETRQFCIEHAPRQYTLPTTRQLGTGSNKINDPEDDPNDWNDGA